MVNFPSSGVLLGDGRGGFRRGSFPSFPYSYSVRPLLGHFTAKQRVSVAFHTRFVTSSPDGEPIATTAAISQCETILFAADFNGDGLSDAVCQASISLNSGDGEFRLSSEFVGVPLLQ